jgi:hypothetical protein
MFAPALHRRGSVVVLSALVLAAAGCQAPGAGTTGARTPTPAPATAPAAAGDAVSPPSVEQILANARAARERHDARALNRFRAALTDRVGGDAIQAARAGYRRALDNYRAADAAHDTRARAAFRAELVALCAPTSLASAFEACDVDLTSVGG